VSSSPNIGCHAEMLSKSKKERGAGAKLARAPRYFVRSIT